MRLKRNIRRIIVQDWDNAFIESESAAKRKDGSTAESDFLDESSKFIIKTWSCERLLGQASNSVQVSLDRLGECFMATLRETANQAGQAPKLENGRSFNIPWDTHLGELGPKHERITNFIRNSLDYQLTPWALFKECSKEDGYSLRDSFYLCYEVLRPNRMRPEIKRKLMDIRGDWANGGDNMGDWYQFFGMANMATWFGFATKPFYSLMVIDDLGDDLEVRNDMIGMDAGKRAKNLLRSIEENPNLILSSKEACRIETIIIGAGSKN